MNTPRWFTEKEVAEKMSRRVVALRTIRTAGTVGTVTNACEVEPGAYQLLIHWDIPMPERIRNTPRLWPAFSLATSDWVSKDTYEACLRELPTP